jgi:hypothetical protein
MARIVDVRTEYGRPIKELPAGSWYVRQSCLYLKVSHCEVIDAETGRPIHFNEDHEVTPVDVEIRILN